MRLDRLSYQNHPQKELDVVTLIYLFLLFEDFFKYIFFEII